MRPSSARRPRGHQPPQGTPCRMAASRAARSTPVCPPETIFSRTGIAMVPLLPGRAAAYHSARRPGARPGPYNPSHFPGCLPMAVRWFLLLFLACAQAAEARMYQWIDPDTRTTQLSGKPPTWYRSPEGGPRVLVFERGRMVDDTARPVSESERQRLREEALVRAEQDQAAIEARLAEARRMQLLL